MNDLTKVLVVDDGSRDAVDPLSAELLELGLSSVTTSVEAADEVLGVVAKPSAIIIKMPDDSGPEVSRRFLDLAKRLRQREGFAGVPVIVWDRSSAFIAGGIGAMLRVHHGPEAFARTGG